MKYKTLISLTMFALVVPATQATVVFSHSFTGTGGLNATAVDTGTGSWIAAPNFGADGSFTEVGGGSATLPFTPSSGLIYTLDVSFRNLAPTAAVGNPEQDWVATGFANGTSSLTGSRRRFVNGDIFGKAWMLYRGVDTAGTLPNAAWVGTTISGAPQDPASTWSDSALANTYGTGIDMRVVLDTTSATYTATWYAKLPTDSAFTEVRPKTDLLDQDINSVGVAISNVGFSGDLTAFSLTAIPEPSTAILGGLGLLALLRRRRK